MKTAFRRNAQGQRICDVAPGCPGIWPCPTHGTRAVLGIHAIDSADILACKRCGFHVCACEQFIALTCAHCGHVADGHVHRCPVQEAKPEPVREQRFKVGDRVRCIDVDGVLHIRLGDTYRVTAVDAIDDAWLFLDGKLSSYQARRFELATPADTAEALPPGWEPMADYQHIEGVLHRATDRVVWADFGTGCTQSWKWAEREDDDLCAGKGFDSMVGACAAALGYRVLIERAGLGTRYFRYHRDGGSSALYRTADEAARAACEAHGAGGR